MNVIKPDLSRPARLDGWLTDAGSIIGKVARSGADILNRATSPTVVTTMEEDNTPLFLGLAGIGLVGALLIMKTSRKPRRR